MKSTKDDMTQEEVLEMHNNNEKEFNNLANEMEKLRKMNSNYTLYPIHVTTTTTGSNQSIWKTTSWDNMVGPTAYLTHVFGVATANSKGLTISQDVYSWRKVKKYGLKVIFLMWLFKNGIKNKNPFGPVSITTYPPVITNYPSVPYTTTTADGPLPSVTWTVASPISNQAVTHNNTVA